MDGKDPIQDLERRKRELTDRWLAYKSAAQREAAEFGFWGVVGGVAIAADFALLGGIGTVIATVSGAGWLRCKREAKRIEREMKDVDRSLDRLHEERADWSRQHPQPAQNLAEEFSPAAKRQIEALKSRLEELEKQMDKVTAENDKSIDKPKFRPPGPKPAP
ncbi:MAG: hypothetical protein EPN97_08405 [Alphaproteobacteria bacterium]|nr:MAG: hypothetical protein EPN97_08405 [Alphaproteobacteria bacterium]